MVRAFANWGGTASCRPSALVLPESEEDLASAVREASRVGERVKVAGSGHSFTDVACTNGLMIRLDRMNRVIEADPSTGLVTVEAGITLWRLNAELSRRGLALANLGDVAYQTISGAISTGTHGTGVRLGNLATQVLALTLVTADGAVLRCAPDEDPEVFQAARLALGALGAIATVTLQCVPAFNLRAVEEPGRLEEVLEGLDGEVDRHDHFEFYWFPHTETCIVKRDDRTDEPPRPKGRARTWIDDILLSNRVYGLVCRLGRLRPAWIPPLARMTARAIGRSEEVDRSDRVFVTPRLVRFAEMEYAIPRAAAAGAVREVRSMIERRGFRVSFPVEVRFVAPDDIFLSPSHGRETCFVAFHMFRGMPYEPYFREAEAIMTALGGRPHWGKLHFQTSDTLRDRYPEWERFAKVRARLDPEGRFRNAYLDRVLGEP